MKKVILLLIISALGLSVRAQVCTPDTTIKQPGIYPEYLDTATVGEAYEHILQILAISDTTVLFGGQPITVPVDSIQLLSIQGMPASFSYACEPVNCTYANPDVGCAVITGAPTSAEQGVHPLDIVVRSYVTVFGTPTTSTDTLRDFVLVVNDSSVNSIAILSSTSAVLSPNPSSRGWLQVQAFSPIQRLEIYDQNGRSVAVLNVDNQRFYEADLQVLGQGVYHVNVLTQQGLIRKRWVRL